MGVTLVRGSAAGTTLRIDADGGLLCLADDIGEGPAMAVIRPESVTLHRHQPEGSARNVWQGTVRSLQPMHDRVRVIIDGRPPVIATVTPPALAELGLHAGAPVWVSVKAVEIRGYLRASH
jgi:molybdate transport system ATP-binding protein